LQRRVHLVRDLTDHKQNQGEVERTCAGSATHHGGKETGSSWRRKRVASLSLHRRGNYNHEVKAL
jgi:hypothetical protein